MSGNTVNVSVHQTHCINLYPRIFSSVLFAPICIKRYNPPVVPNEWTSIRLADKFAAVCPQNPPISPTGRDALFEVPRERLAQIRRLLPLLSNQSEDCLYLNLYVPRTG